MNYPFHKVLFIGPADRYGGMGAVLRNYENAIEDFNFIATHDHERSKYLFFLIQLGKVIKFIMVHEDLEIVHIHSASRGSFIRKSLILMISKIFGKKVVFHVHGGGFIDFYESNKYAQLIIRWILSKADLLICLSDEWRKYFIGFSFNKHIVQLNNPVQKFPFKKIIKDSPILKLLFLGRISVEKGLFDLLDFLKNNSHFRNGLIKLTIGGVGDREKLNAVLADNVYHNRVKYLGWLNETDKQYQLNENDVFILPSYFEGLPVSILEAMSARMPVIASNVGGIPSVVKHGLNGWLFPPGSFDSLTPIFDALIANRDCIGNYGEQSLLMVQPYMTDQIIQDLSDVYSTL